MKKVILLGILAVCAGLIAWRVMSAVKASDIPTTPDTITEWMCTKCREPFKLNAREVLDRANSKDRVLRGEKADPKQIIFKCDKCSDFSVYRAGQCTTHNVWFCIGWPKEIGCKECLK